MGAGGRTEKDLLSKASGVEGTRSVPAEEGTVSAKARAQLMGQHLGMGWGWGTARRAQQSFLWRVWLQFGGLNSVQGLQLDHSHCWGW